MTKRLLLAFIALFGLISFSAAPLLAADQPVDDVESLRRQVNEQKTQIAKLSEALQRQQQLLDSLAQKLETSGVTQGRTSEPAVVQTTSSVEPTSVESGFGKIKFNGLLQGWFAAGDAGFHDTFRIRRTELKFSGDIMPKVGWTVMVDPSRGLSLNNSFSTVSGVPVVTGSSVDQGSRLLQDAFITLKQWQRANIDFGQLKLPLGLEGNQSSSALDTVERALFMSDGGRGGNLADVRDIGVMLYGPLNPSLDYWVGTFNGVAEHQNDVDSNNRKAIVGRVVFRPAFIQGLQLGSSGAWGNGPHADQPRRNRLGGEALFQRGPVTLKSEVMTAQDSNAHRLGYYGHFGYRFNPKVEGIVRYDTFDPDTRLNSNSSDVTEHDYIAGLNYFVLENHVKLQLNYLRKTFADDIVKSRNELLLNLQTAW